VKDQLMVPVDSKGGTRDSEFRNLWWTGSSEFLGV